MRRHVEPLTVAFIIVIFVILLGIGFASGYVLPVWALFVATVGLAVAGYMTGEQLVHGEALSSLGSAIFFMGFVLPGVAGFAIGALVAKVARGRAQ